MAQGFNSHQATQDLKFMLNLHEHPAHTSQNDNDVDMDGSSMLINSNGNALNSSVSQPKAIASRPQLREVPLPKQKNKTRKGSNENIVHNSKSNTPRHPDLSKTDGFVSPKAVTKKLFKEADTDKNNSGTSDDGRKSDGLISSDAEVVKKLESIKLSENTKAITTDKVPERVASADARQKQTDDRNSSARKVENRGTNNTNNNKPRPTKHGDEGWSADFLHKLEHNKINVLKKKNQRFPRAKFFCRLCEYHMDLVDDCEKHMKDNRHNRRIEVSAVDAVLRSIPLPTPSQLEALTEAVENVYRENGISETEQKSRLEVVKRLEKIIQAKSPDALINMYGSSLTGFGLKTADINVDLNTADKNKKLTVLLNEVYLILREEQGTGFSNVKTDFLAKVPVLLLKDDATGYQVTIAIHCYSALCSGHLLNIYSEFDLRVRKLAVAFRYWAHLFGLDRHYDGFIHPQALNIMVIYYLQNYNPQVVPIIYPPKVSGEDVGDFRKDSPAFEKMKAKVMKHTLQKRNDLSLGELWLGLIRFYSLEFDVINKVVSIRSGELKRTMKPWNSRKLSVEDPYMTKKNITRMLNNGRIYEYWQDSVKKSYHYFGLPRDDQGKSLISDEELKSMRNKPETSSEENKSVPGNQAKAASPIEGVQDKGEFDETVVIPQNPLIAKYKKPQKSEKEPKSSVDKAKSAQSSDGSRISVEESPASQSACSSTTEDKSASSLGEPDKKSEDGKLPGGSHTDSATTEENKSDDGNGSEDKEAANRLDRWKERKLLYEFTKENFLTDGKGPILVCTYCEQEGHLKNNCPEDELPEILPLPALTPHHIEVLSETLNRVPSEVGLNEESIRERAFILQDLENFVKQYYDDAQLTLFGSSCNGFGFYKSDMDICMTFARKNIAKIDKTVIIEALARRLKQHPGLMSVQAITTAKVPIVKFTVKKVDLEGDISLYNTLAQQNTKLLFCYSLIDPRVRILGYTIKTFAKVCDIGDASRGSLSSYAYILMMLYYLQQVKPPVIPVLQELYVGTRPTLEIEGSEAWFMDDLTQLDKLWPHKGENKLSVAELWLGFLRFYVEEFNYKEQVITIRQYLPLTRFEKLWNGSCLAIEDPFDLNHNLGSGLTRKMTNYIFKTFINGRILYGSPIDDNMEIFDKYQNPTDYFFDTDLLSENRPINVRGCRKCGRIGHLARHCPERKYDDPKKQQQQPPTPSKPQQQSAQLQQQPGPYKAPPSSGKHQASLQKQPPASSQAQQKPSASQSQGLQRNHQDNERRGPSISGVQNQGSSSVNSSRNQTPQKQSGSTGQPAMNLVNHPQLQQVTPSQLRPYSQGQVFLNSQFSQPAMHQYQQQQVQHSLQQPQQHPGQLHQQHPGQLHQQQQMQNMQQHQMQLHQQQMQQQQRSKQGILAAPPGLLAQPLMSVPSRPTMSYPQNYSYGQPPMLYPNNANYGAAGLAYNGQMAGSAGARRQYSLNPVVQNLFASAHNQILEASSNNQTQVRKQ